MYESSRIRPAVTAIKPGQTIKLTTLWSGTANQPGVKKLNPGTYTIQVDDDGYLASTTVQVTGPHGKAQAKTDHGGCDLRSCYPECQIAQGTLGAHSR